MTVPTIQLDNHDSLKLVSGMLERQNNPRIAWIISDSKCSRSNQDQANRSSLAASTSISSVEAWFDGTVIHPSSPISLRRQTYEYFSQGLYLALLLLLLLAVAGVHLHPPRVGRICTSPG